MIAELRDPADVRSYVARAIWLTRAARPTPARVQDTLNWAFALAADGHPLPPLGFLTDAGLVGFGFDPSGDPPGIPALPSWPPALSRGYDDYLLGKLYSDWTFERAADALRRYPDADRPRALGYVVRQMGERNGFPKLELPVAALRALRDVSAVELLREGEELWHASGPGEFLKAQYEHLTAAARRSAELLGTEDLIALEQRTAIADLGQYVAHRQILEVTSALESRLPARPVRPLPGRKEVPTRVHDEDQYPVGGYTSISNRGSVESLLHSQLAFMEPHDRPDLFDVKFVRDELFFYSRDENQFLRRRRAFVVLFRPELRAARFKDPDLSHQRIVFACGLVLAAVRRLERWLSSDALRFELLFIAEGGTNPLAEEFELFEILLKELRDRGAAAVATIDSPAAATKRILALVRQAQVHALDLGGSGLEADGAAVASLQLPSAFPVLSAGGREIPLPDDDPADAWATATLRLLQLWV
jgi:hypothetical protein